MNIMGLNNDPLCEYCEGELEYLGKTSFRPCDMKRIRVKDLARFILKSRRFLVNEISN